MNGPALHHGSGIYPNQDKGGAQSAAQRHAVFRVYCRSVRVLAVVSHICLRRI